MSRYSRLTVLVLLWTGLAISLLFWLYHYFKVEHTIYYWDYLGYWQMGACVADAAVHQGISAALLMLRSSLSDDYNKLPDIPSAFVMAILGPSRLHYVLANAVLLVLPAYFCAMLCLVKISYARWSQVTWAVLALTALMLHPLPWFVTVFGLVDVGGLIFAVIAAQIIIQTDLRARNHEIRWLILGVVFAMLSLYRRWYLFLVVGLIIVFFFDIAFSFIVTVGRLRRIPFALLRTNVFGPILCISVFLAIFCGASWPLPWRILTTDYSVTYSAYQAGNSLWSAMMANVTQISSSYGGAQLALGVLCFPPALILKPTRRTALYLFFPAVIAWAYFSRTQTMGFHHCLLVFLALLIMPLILSKCLVSLPLISARVIGWVLLAFCVLLSFLNFQAAFSARVLLPIAVSEVSLTHLKRLPIVRHDLPQFEALLQFVARKVELPGVTNPPRSVYLVASSEIINSSQLISANFQLGKALPGSDYICVTHDVDLRDGFPQDLVTAKVVLVADPVQTHLQKEQKVISVPTRLFLQNEGFARAFVKDPESFLFDGGVRVYAYERVRPSTPQEIAELHQQIGLL